MKGTPRRRAAIQADQAGARERAWTRATPSERMTRASRPAFSQMFSGSLVISVMADMPPAGPFDLCHHPAAGAGDEGGRARRNDRLHHFHGASFHPAGVERRQHLQNGGGRVEPHAVLLNGRVWLMKQLAGNLRQRR